jgi:hypothetical protein
MSIGSLTFLILCASIKVFLCAHFHYPAHINAIVEFQPHLLQHFKCDGLHHTTDSVPGILERLGTWGK